MNIEAYDIDSLRKLVRSLQNENTVLKAQLQKANIPYEEYSHFEEQIENLENYDPDQGERIIIPEYITDDMAKRYFALFWGRHDVFAKRGKNGGYFSQCNNRWNNALCPKQRGEKVFCDECENTQWTPLELWRIKEHLKGTKEDGTDVLGIYPLLADGTCRFIVFDFDNHEKGAEATDYANTDNEWHAEVDALRKMCEQNGIKPLVERSRSGRGAHVWIFFKRPISASLAQNFGFGLNSLSLWHNAIEAMQDRNWIFVEDMFDEDTVIMGGDPTPNVTIEEMDLFARQAETEKDLADAYAMASNKAWWVEDDIYDYEEGTPEHKEACRITEEWFAVAEIIRNKIFEILKSEGAEVTNRGYIEILKPFMARNGYRDGNGWWVHNND